MCYNGADRPSLDRVNSIDFLEVGQVCDGSLEHKHRPRKTPMLVTTYKLKKPINIDALKPTCRTSKITVNDNTRKRIIEDICTGEEINEENTKQIRKANTIKKSSISFFGRGSNTREFWEDVADSLTNLEDFGMKKLEQKRIRPKIQRKRSNEFRFG